MEGSPNPSLILMSPSSVLSRKRKLSPRSRSQSCDSDDSYSTNLTRSRSQSYERDKSYRCDVSKWDNGILESYGIFYDEKATELSELTKSVLEGLYSVEFYGIKDRAAFWTKLLEIKECLIESTKKCMSSFDEDSDSIIMSCKIEKIENFFIQARRNIKEEFMSMRIGSASSDFLSRHLFSLWYAGITEFVQYYSDLIQGLISGKRTSVEGAFIQLLILFSKILLLNPVRGDAWQKVEMRLNGIVDITSVSDIRYTVLGEPTRFSTGSSLMTGTVGEVNMWLQLNYMENARDFSIRDEKFRSQPLENMLGQHGGELLVEIMNSAIPNTSFGIICVKTTIIFTRLDLSTEHFQKLRNGDKLEDDRSRILYSRPYNFLIRKDREEILDTMFQLGLLCRVRSLYYQD
ncbi:uncharacterized protein LOC133186382 [Saccostrea echinata]|uniref:uncharacterized protein LOC133186382 n=1 Tax=Saccostrea echinata TaxID=191078 RepID=UPI002A815D1C|nr:uncharacterized protein LOC133186382 [Saccostrea echinata]XP_061177622.1 uncharacterized protein LOC133186382 [Saccostrea echinata]